MTRIWQSYQLMNKNAKERSCRMQALRPVNFRMEIEVRKWKEISLGCLDLTVLAQCDVLQLQLPITARLPDTAI
jgi:hypothetical protein